MPLALGLRWELHARKGAKPKLYNLEEYTVFTQLMKKFWADECGAVVATEYLMLGSIVAAGSVTGLVSMRDAMNSEYQEFGNSIREIRQTYTPAELTQKGAKKPATYQYGQVEYVPAYGANMAP